MTLTDRQPIEAGGTTRVAQRSSSMPQVVGGGVLISIGLLWLLERAGTIDVTVTTVLAIGTALVGISLMLLANDGSHGGLIVFGTVLGLVALLTATAPFEGFQGGLGDRTYRVSSVGDIRADYNQAIGALTLDLRQIDDWSADTRVTASVGIGELVIRVPNGVPVRVDARIGAGEIEIFGRESGGVGLDESYESAGFGESSHRLSLVLEAFTGRVEVTDE